jgi:hypothetical protein
VLQLVSIGMQRCPEVEASYLPPLGCFRVFIPRSRSAHARRGRSIVVHLSTATLASQLSDPWLAVDKLQHLVACAAIVLAVYWALAKPLSGRKGARLALAVIASLVFAGGKELGDYLHVRSCAMLHTCCPPSSR